MTTLAPDLSRSGKAPAEAASPSEGAFSNLGLDSALLEALEARGFETPTTIQLQAIPPALEGRDLIATAMTGSGKTAAFLLPILHRMISQPRRRTRALILVPTRELAAQVVEELRGLTGSTGIRGAAIFGGVNPRPQERAFRDGVDVLVATPGRLLDHLSRDYARLDSVETVVLDEADRMLDMGFLPEVRKILRYLPKGPRQTLLFSATMPDAITRLGQEILRSPIRVRSQKKEAPPTSISQTLVPVSQQGKADLLTELLRTGEIGQAIVFCRTKHRAKRLSRSLARSGLDSTEIHGNRSQRQRTDALAGFRSGKYSVLVATDIVARGIDIDALPFVVNFDVPAHPEDYIHRIGRTARGDATGEAFTLVAPEEEASVRAIERVLGRSIPRRGAA
jgi:ATP-dependent RNA helicase RhlE